MEFYFQIKNLEWYYFRHKIISSNKQITSINEHKMPLKKTSTKGTGLILTMTLIRKLGGVIVITTKQVRNSLNI